MEHEKNLGGLLLAGLLAAPLSVPAADDMFLRLEGIKGEVLDTRHRDGIEILSYTQSFTRTGAGKTTCGPVTIMKYVDQSSPDLILFLAGGRQIARAVITFRKPGQPPFEYYRVTLESVVVTEVEQSNSRLNFPNPAPPRAIEKVSLVGQRYRVDYFGQTADGRPGAQPKAGWDCGANHKI